MCVLRSVEAQQRSRRRTYDADHNPLLARGPVPRVNGVVSPIIFCVLQRFLLGTSVCRVSLLAYVHVPRAQPRRTFLSSGNADSPSPPWRTPPSFFSEPSAVAGSWSGGEGTWVPEEMVDVWEISGPWGAAADMVNYARAEGRERRRRRGRSGRDVGTGRDHHGWGSRVYMRLVAPVVIYDL